MDTAAPLREAQERYNTFKAKNLSLNMTRGKPSPQQLDLANPMFSLVTSESYRDDQGTDCRNYGGLDGLPEMKAIFAEFLEVRPEEVIIGGNASIQEMHLRQVPTDSGTLVAERKRPVFDIADLFNVALLTCNYYSVKGFFALLRLYSDD